MTGQISKMKIGLYAAAMFLGALGSACFIFAPRYSTIKPFGMAFVVLGAYFFSIAGKQKTSVGGDNLDKASTINSITSKKLDILARCLSLVAILPVVASYLFLRSDALDGGRQVWPAYAFAASVLLARSFGVKFSLNRYLDEKGVAETN